MLTMLVFGMNSLMNFVVSLLIAKFLGPSEFGRLGLALSFAVVAQLFLFDWLRLAATRFCGSHGGQEDPRIRATLDAAFGATAFVAVAAAIAIYVLKLDLVIPPDLLALAIGVSIANGLFDFASALLRARFLDRSYGLLVVGKTVFALVLTVGGAALFGSAQVALLAMMLSVAGAVFTARTTLFESHSEAPRPSRALAARIFRYGVPIVSANILYQSIPLLNRLLVSRLLGFAEAGQLSLAYEIGIRIVASLGSALDAILFQIAVKKEKTHGADAARAQIASNMGVVFAVIAPALVGCWMILPSFQALFVPASFRGPFLHYFTLLLPTFFGFALINFAVNPAYQLEHRLAPLIIGALVAVTVNLIVIGRSDEQSADVFALAQSASSVAGLLALFLMLLRLEPMWPRLRDVLGTLISCGIMGWVTHALRELTPGLGTMLLQIVFGVVTYGASAALFDLAGVRRFLVGVAALRHRR
jgi:O-antigen/teichoic acid export membrane protein